VYASRVDGHHSAIGRPLGEYAPRPDDVLLFHYTTWSPTADFLLVLERPVVLMYHNVTPPVFFAGLDDRAAEQTRRGREQLGRFADRCPLAAAKSTYSSADLRAAGFPRIDVLPFRVDFDRLDRACDQGLLRALRSGAPSILTMGRVVPNKRHEDVIAAFAYYRARIEPDAVLYCVGSHDERGAYHGYLRWLIRQLGLGDSVRFTGQVPDEHRGAYYRGCRAYITMSEHEGFCVPIVEAMHLGQPAIGFDATAVPETMGDAGVLIRQKRHDAIGEAIGLLAADTPLRARLVERGRANAARYAPAAIEARFARMLADALDA
jgi:glycosyltransferase involved in cell wall biosynthesis